MGRSRKPAARKPLAPKDSNVEHAHPPPPPHSDATRQTMLDVNHREAERHIAAIYAVREAQTQGYLTQLRVALSLLSEDVRAMRLDEFVSRFCPDREFIRDPDSNIIELTHKPQGSVLPGVAASFEPHTEDAKPFLQNCMQPTPTGFPITSSAVMNMSQQISDKVAQDKPEDEDFLKFMESFRSSKLHVTTPVVNSHSQLGVTPKTMRFPKKGETLLSINGSPLGVFKEVGVQAVPDERPRRARRKLRASVRLSDF